MLNINKIWTVTTVALTCCIAYQTTSVIRFLEDAKKHQIPSNSFEDLILMVVSLFILSILRIGMDRAIRNWIKRRLTKFEGEKLTEFKFEKNVRASVSLVWYTFATLYGYFLLKGHEYLPEQFLGSCSCSQVFEQWPYYKTDGNVRTFYMVMLAHHFYSLVELYWSARRRPDTAEMFLHHIATVSLMLFSYYQNHIPAGLSLLVAHNVGDIMLNFCRIARDLRLAVSLYTEALVVITMFLSWFVPRVWLIGTCIVPASVNYLNKQDWPENDLRLFFFEKYHGALTLQVSMVVIIVVLNVHWSFIILSLMYNKVVNKKFEIKGGEGY